MPKNKQKTKTEKTVGLNLKKKYILTNIFRPKSVTSKIKQVVLGIASFNVFCCVRVFGLTDSNFLKGAIITSAQGGFAETTSRRAF